VSTDQAELSSIAAVLEDMTKRVTSIAERQQAAARDDVASDLYEVERNLRTANRRLAKLLRATRTS
jgi:hypothetical protein